MKINTGTMRQVEHHADFCVVGGGLAGMIAAREGAKVVLMQENFLW